MKKKSWRQMSEKYLLKNIGALSYIVNHFSICIILT